MLLTVSPKKLLRIFYQVIEFVQFKERLQRSNQYLVARVEASILQLKQKTDNIEEEEVSILFLFIHLRLCFYVIDDRYRYFLFQGILESLNCGIHFVELSNEIRSKNLTFNEDFQSRPWWTPFPEKNYLLGQHKIHLVSNFNLLGEVLGSKMYCDFVSMEES